MATSYNGYQVLPTPTYTGWPRLRRWLVPGTKVILPVRDGSVGFLLVFIASWMHETINRIDQPHPADDWGWAFRAVRGQTSGYSCHASGTAVDLDATEHVLGRRGTFRYLVRGKLAEARLRWFLRARIRGAVRWGGDYQNRADEMHFEVMAPIERCEVIARHLMNTDRGRRILAANPGAKGVILS